MISIIIPCKEEKDIVDMVNETEKAFPDAQIIVSSDRAGNGKGWAIRQAIEYAKGDVICFIDGDLDIHPQEINKLLISMSYFDIVVGRKNLSGSLLRKIITFCSRLFIGIMFGLWIDTQTGVKIFAREYLPSWDNDSFAFDIEILYKAKRMGARIKEVPVNVNIRKGMPSKSILRFIKGAWQIRCKLK